MMASFFPLAVCVNCSRAVGRVEHPPVTILAQIMRDGIVVNRNTQLARAFAATIPDQVLVDAFLTVVRSMSIRCMSCYYLSTARADDETTKNSTQENSTETDSGKGFSYPRAIEVE